MEREFFIGEPMDLEFEDLRVRRGTWVDSLALAYAIHSVHASNPNLPGTALAGVTGSVSWESTDGDYYARIDQSATIDAALVAGTAYFLRLHGGSGANAVNRYVKIRARYRAET